MSGDRARLLALRRAQDPLAAVALSHEVIRRFIEACEIAPTQWRGLRVGLYRALPAELDLRMLEKLLMGWGAELCFPRVLNASLGVMEMAHGFSSSQKWSKGSFGVEEPPVGHPAMDPASLDLIFIPGVSFGEQGERVGMGAGFYDRFLPKAPKALRVALAFDFQLLSKLDQQSWDQRVDWIWTERRQIQLKAWKPPVRK